MSALMPQILTPLSAAAGAFFDLITVDNSVFGPRVTTAGLLPGRDLVEALRGRGDLDLALIPGEAVNDDGLFIDSMSAAEMAAAVPIPIRLSKTFADAVDE
jgi:NifB/MoaA-like Fe-S oxidoreductase